MKLRLNNQKIHLILATDSLFKTNQNNRYGTKLEN